MNNTSINSNNSFLKNANNFINNNPILVFALGIVFTILFFNFVEKKEVEPRYLISDVTYIANVTEDAPNFKMFWEDKQITNINSVTIALWNRGKQFLGNENISDTDPIKVIFPSETEVLQVEIINKSRTELKFNYRYYPSDEDRRSLIINIDGDEALEKNDGFQLKIYFTGNLNEDFKVDGRIFGSKDGFRKANPNSGGTYLFFAFIILVIISIFLFNVFIPIIEKNKGMKLYLVWIVFWTVLGVIMIFVFFIANEIYQNNAIPSWVNIEMSLSEGGFY